MITEYRTSDIVLAACLKMERVKLERIDREGRRGIFVFVNVPEEFISNFDSGLMLVEPASFNSEVRTLNTAIKRLIENHV